MSSSGKRHPHKGTRREQHDEQRAEDGERHVVDASWPIDRRTITGPRHAPRTIDTIVVVLLDYNPTTMEPRCSMRVGDFGVEVLAVQGDDLRELDTGHVLARPGAVYALRLRNFGPLRCVANVEIDGKTV